MKIVREPAVAGMFYSASSNKLQRDIEDLFNQVDLTESFDQIIGIISPHAGYVYSGKTAVYAYSTLKNKTYKRVVVISPSHREYFRGISVYNGDAYKTPFGEIDVDKEFVSKLIENEKLIFSGINGHRNEHALEVQLPFLQTVLRNFLLVPIVMGDQRKIFVDSLAEKLSNIIDEETLIVASSLGGIIFYGPALNTTFNLDGRAAVATYMFTAGASFYIPFYLTRKEPVSVASAWLAIYGESRGAIHGVSLATLLNMNSRGTLRFALFSSIIEGTGGYLYARNNNLTAGQTSAMQTYGDIGSGVGFLIARSAGLYDNSNNMGKKIASTYLLSNFASLAFGRYISSKYNYSNGDSYFLGTTSILSGLSAFTVINYFDPKNDKAYTTSVAIGTLGGMYLGHYFAKNYDYTLGQGILTTCGSTAFALIGYGLGYIAFNNADSKLLLTTTTLGGWSGFYILKSVFDNSNKQTTLSKLNLKMNLGMLPIYESNLFRTPNFTINKIAPTLKMSLTF